MRANIIWYISVISLLIALEVKSKTLNAASDETNVNMMAFLFQYFCFNIVIYTVLETVSRRKLRDPPPRGTAWWIT